MKNDLNFEYYSYLCATELNNNLHARETYYS